MQIGVLGTGTVGQALAGRLAELGHQVVVGTRDPQATLARGSAEPDSFGGWLEANSAVRLDSFAEAVRPADLVMNATSGNASLDVLAAAGPDNLVGKVLIDVANPLDFTQGFPPSLFAVNTDSLAERIQRAHPQTHVVKTLNVVTAAVMVHPERVGGGDHSMFVAGNDPGAKEMTAGLLGEFGWQDVIDVGDITAARGLEMYLPLWLRLMGALESPAFNIKVVR